MNSSAVPSWADTSCLLCGAPPPVGHHRGCPGGDLDTVHYLIETLPDGARRSWTMAGARYTATKARRAAITALMPTMNWHQAGRKVSLPFSIGALINEIVPRLGVQRWLARFGFHPLATVRVPDCGCTDVLRCRCDVDGHPHAQAHPDLWAEAALLVLRLRRPAGWLDLWLLDLGTAVVIVAEDDRGNDPIPTDTSVDCQMGWCDLCPGTRPVGDAPTAQPCTHTCHTATATAGGAQPGTEGRG